MKKLHRADVILGLEELLIKNGSLFNRNHYITTEEFVTILIRNCIGNAELQYNDWSSNYMQYALHQGIIDDYDMTNAKNFIERRSAARIIHELLLIKLGEKDEKDWSCAENLKDLYTCHTCVMHIAQVYLKGIIKSKSKNIFDVNGNITGEEAADIIIRILDKMQRIPITKSKTLKVINLTPKEAWELIQHNSKVKLVDVRSKEEYKEGHIKRSICIPLMDISNNPFLVCENKDIPIILYCQKGFKSTIAAQMLIDAGYKKVYTIPGIGENYYNLII